MYGRFSQDQNFLEAEITILSYAWCSATRALRARVLRYEARRTEQKFPEAEKFPHICLDWHDIYELPINALIDTRSGEFHDRILNRYLTTNSFHFKICLANSPLQYVAQYPDSTSIRTLKTKTQFFRHPS